ncbi:coxsackievirus and adenovirus receptor homolog [Clarias gariepinus]
MEITVSFLYICAFITCVGSFHAEYWITVNVGGTVVLPCERTDESKQTLHVSWRHRDNTVFKREGDGVYYSAEFKGRVDVPKERLHEGDCSLVLTNVRESDAGVYKSYLTQKHTAGSGVQHMSRVEVTVKDNYKVLDGAFMRSNALTNGPHTLIVVLSLLSCFLLRLY